LTYGTHVEDPLETRGLVLRDAHDGERRRGRRRLQLVQQRVLPAGSVLVVDQQPVEAGESGQLDRDRRTEVEKGAGQPLAAQHAATEIRGKFHGVS
jgi:hypothetical protein